MIQKTKLSVWILYYPFGIRKEAFLVEVEALLQNKFNKTYFDKCLSDEYALIAQNEAFIVDQNGEIVPVENNEAGQDLLARQKALALNEGIRAYNLALRRAFEKALNNIQDKVIQQKKEELKIEYTPSSIFGAANYVTQKFEQIKAIGKNFKDSENYIKALSEAI
jgi:hypothetical protein